MVLLLSFSALIASTILLQLGNGALGPLDVLSGIKLNFSNTELGILGSAHFLGFLFGCWFSPRMMGKVGHIRSFAVFASLGAVAALLHPLIIEPYAWSFMRIASGASIAGSFTVIEAWLNSKVDNKTRGSVFGVYRFADLGAQMLAQLMVGFLEPASFVSYNLLAMFFCLCLLPLTLTSRVVPEVPKSPRLRLLSAYRLSPLGFLGVFVAGVTTAAFRMVSPIYCKSIGLAHQETTIFLAISLLGGFLAQIPVGWLADYFDRRWIITFLSVAAIVVSLLTAISQPQTVFYIYLAAFLFGVTTFPIFSVSAAHANDFASVDSFVDLAASLIFVYGLGAIASPFLSSILVEQFGSSALFLFIAFAHLFLCGFGLFRMMIRPTLAIRTPHIYLPRTTLIFGRFVKPKRMKD